MRAAVSFPFFFRLIAILFALRVRNFERVYMRTAQTVVMSKYVFVTLIPAVVLMTLLSNYF